MSHAAFPCREHCSEITIVKLTADNFAPFYFLERKQILCSNCFNILILENEETKRISYGQHHLFRRAALLKSIYQTVHPVFFIKKNPKLSPSLRRSTTKDNFPSGSCVAHGVTVRHKKGIFVYLCLYLQFTFIMKLSCHRCRKH